MFIIGSHFTDEEIKVELDEVRCPKFHMLLVVEMEFKPR